MEKTLPEWMNEIPFRIAITDLRLRVCHCHWLTTLPHKFSFFDYLSVLGSTGNCTVHRVLLISGFSSDQTANSATNFISSIRAVKVIKPPFKEIISELHQSSRLAHIRKMAQYQTKLHTLSPHLLRIESPLYFELQHPRGGNEVAIMMQFCPYSVSKISEPNIPMANPIALWIIRSLLLGLEALHKYGITHGDVKPSNLLVDPYGTIKLADLDLFGMTAHTSEYLSPNFYKTQTYTFVDDVWSVGISMIELLEGRVPFSDMPSFRIPETVMNLGPQTVEALFERKYLCPKTRHFLRQSLILDPEKRPSVSQLLQDKAFESASRAQFLNAVFQRKNYGVGDNLSVLPLHICLAIFALVDPLTRKRATCISKKYYHLIKNHFGSICETMNKIYGPDLKKYMDKQLVVKLVGNRKIRGVLRGYDPFMNLVLEETVEEIQDNNNTETRKIGQVVIRGNSVVLLEPQEKI